MPLTWEKYKATEIEDLLRLMSGFAHVAHLPWDSLQRKQNVAEFTANAKQGDIWFVILDGRKIGYAVNVFGFSFEFGGRVAFIDEFYIEESHQRAGIGGQTLDFIAKDAGRTGSVAMLLEASDSESHLHAFYEKSGFARRDYRLYCKMLSGNPGLL